MKITARRLLNYLPVIIVLSLMVGRLVLAYTPPLPNANLIPSSDVSNLMDVYNRICDVAAWMLVFGCIIGVLFVVWGGVRYVTAGGDSSKEEDAKKIILGAVIGVVFLILAVALIRIITSFFTGTTVSLDLTNCNY